MLLPVEDWGLDHWSNQFGNYYIGGHLDNYQYDHDGVTSMSEKNEEKWQHFFKFHHKVYLDTSHSCRLELFWEFWDLG